MKGEDLTNKTFDRLEVLWKRPFNDKNGQAYYMVRCICGVRKFSPGRSLRRGRSRSCGCRRTEPRYRRNAVRDQEIIQLKLKGLGVREIAKIYNITSSRISQICSLTKGSK